MNLAIGFVTDYGFDWSMHVDVDATPADIAIMLAEKTKGNNCCGTGDKGLWPDRILIIRNSDNDSGPEVFAQYHAGIDYPRDGQTHFVDWKKNHVTAEGL